jgi:hypothetical protein
VDAVGLRARVNAWRTARMMLHDGGRLYLEFLVQRGEGSAARRLRARRRRPAQVARELEQSGARVLEREVVAVPTGARTGAPMKICRMVATWE